ncbi:MAG: hypothetical protein ACYTCV_10765 [Planctomycetota bacterium]
MVSAVICSNCMILKGLFSCFYYNGFRYLQYPEAVELLLKTWASMDQVSDGLSPAATLS